MTMNKEARVRKLVDIVLSQECGNATKAAKRLGVSPPWLPQYLSGERKPARKLLDGLAKIFGYPVDECFYPNGTIRPSALFSAERSKFDVPNDVTEAQEARINYWRTAYVQSQCQHAIVDAEQEGTDAHRAQAIKEFEEAEAEHEAASRKLKAMGVDP